jgi:hypothetical protein
MLKQQKGEIECYSKWYHTMGFIFLVIVIVFPFSLVYLASRRVTSWKLVRRNLRIIYRTRLIGIWGQCIQMIRRLILVAVSTFLRVPETVCAFHMS